MSVAPFPAVGSMNWADELESAVDSRVQGSQAFRRIVELAARDGWLAVYDPTNPGTTTVGSDGTVRGIEDALGNLPEIVPTTEGRPRFVEGEFGQLAGCSTDGDNATLLRATFDAPLEQPTTVVVVARADDPVGGSGERFLVDGNGGGASGRNNIFIGNSRTWVAGAGSNALGRDRADSHPHIVVATFDGDRTHLRVDGQTHAFSAGSGAGNSLAGLRLGERYIPNGTHWQGSYGTALVYHGDIPQDVLDRMLTLLHGLTGIPKAGPNLLPHTRAYSVNGADDPTFAHGDPNTLLVTGVASMTKMMTLWTARQHLGSSADLDAVVTVGEGELRGPIWEAGDEVTVRDLMFATAVPSDNGAPAIIGRYVGDLLLADEGRSGSGIVRFREEMNAEAGRLGYEGAVFVGTVGDGVISPVQLVDLMRRSVADSELRAMYSASSHTVTVTGPNSRTVDVTHTVFAEGVPPFPEFVAAKTGTFGGRGHITMVWEHPNGTEHITVILNTDSDNGAERYDELRRVITAVSSDVPVEPTGVVESVPDASGSVTPLLNITELFEGINASGSNSGVYISRAAGWACLTLVSVRLPENFSQTALIPEGFRPQTFFYSEVQGSRTPPLDVRAIQVNSNGNVQIHGNTDSEALRATLSWPIGG